MAIRYTGTCLLHTFSEKFDLFYHSSASQHLTSICRHFSLWGTSMNDGSAKNSGKGAAFSYRKGLQSYCDGNISTYFGSLMEHSLTDCQIQWVNHPHLIIIPAARPNIHFLARNLAWVPTGLCQAIGYYWNRKGALAPVLVSEWSIDGLWSWLLDSLAVLTFKLTQPRHCAFRKWAPYSHLHPN